VVTPRALKLLLFGVEHTARAYHSTDMITSGYGLVRFNGPITFHVVPFITRYHKVPPIERKFSYVLLLSIHILHSASYDILIHSQHRY